MLVDRVRELQELNNLLQAPASRLVAVSGRRRLGKTTLLVHWGKNSGHPYLYWVGSRFPSAVLLAEFSRKVWQHGNPDKRVPRQFSYESWSEAFEMLAEACQGERRHVVILDEFPYAVQSEPGLPSALQNAWDHHLKFSNVCMVLCGSQVGMMERLLEADAPLYGRMVGPLQVRPLPFRATRAFFPQYSAEQRVAVYAILGGVPAYLEQFSGDLSLLENLRRHLFQDVGLFRSDPDYLIGEQVRDLSNYQAVLAAIADGARKPADIALHAKLPHRSGVDPYLAQLVEMDYVRRELPVTVPPSQRATSRASRYILADNYLRFYFRFVRTHLDLIAQQLYDELEKRIAEQLRAFIGMTAFEELCRDWVLSQAQQGRLPFAVEQVGSHWDSQVQVDVAAINWREKALLLGEAKWQPDDMRRAVVRELIEEKTVKVKASLPDNGEGWRIFYAFFSRAGFTAVAQQMAGEYQAQLVDLTQIDKDLAQA
ncbi:MAG TPA: ATP-binding protein [Chloroflexota bacterium]|nr:ATP-binding protein [Chloroflexota bacterium]HUM67312.1 ATP-binding protein [Chloroflexota bacterium]